MHVEMGTKQLFSRNDSAHAIKAAAGSPMGLHQNCHHCHQHLLPLTLPLPTLPVPLPIGSCPCPCPWRTILREVQKLLQPSLVHQVEELHSSKRGPPLLQCKSCIDQHRAILHRREAPSKRHRRDEEEQRHRNVPPQREPERLHGPLPHVMSNRALTWL